MSQSLASKIGQRAEAESALRSVEERYRLASRATNDAIWDWDFSTDHVLWNEAIERTYGYSPADVGPTGDWWIGHIHPDDRSGVAEELESAVKAGRGK